MKITLFVVSLIFLPALIGFAGIILFDVSKEIFVLIMLTVIILLFILFSRSFKSKVNTGYLGNEEEFLDSIFQLTAVVIQVDGKHSKSELSWLKKKLIDDFKQPYANEYFEKFSQYLETDISLKNVCREVNIHFNYPAKIQLLHFLIRLSILDKAFSDKEYELFRKIARMLRLNYKMLNSILAMFNLHQKSNKQKTYSKKRTTPSQTTLKISYQVLGLAQSATDKQVKKAFRKLAIIHHPDKVAHLGEKFQKSAVTKFQKISDAYETIKEKRGFS